MGIDIKEAKAFISDCIAAREDWITWADRSWREIEKRTNEGRLLYSDVPKRRSGKYPIWNSTLKIRQPIVFSRCPIPVGEDTTQDGMDDVAATAALCLERLANGLMKTFDFFDVMSRARDDFLVTNFGECRAYYKCEDVKEPVREYLTPMQDEMTGEQWFENDKGKRLENESQISQDEQGFFIETSKVVDIEKESVCLGHVHYDAIYIDTADSWEEVRRIAFHKDYSVAAFKEVFGASEYAKLRRPESSDEGDKLPKTIRVFELHDDYDNEVLYWAENSEDFIKPKKIAEYDDSEMPETNGLFDLDSFFPCVKPLLINQPADKFWPVPEYYQLVDVLQDIHTIFSRMIALTKAIRARILYDSSVKELKKALADDAEGDATGVSGLAQMLAGKGGSLENVVQYVPVEKLIASLENLYKALDQRLQTYFQLTGTSDLLRGQTDGVERTYGEQQMKEKYALNQISQFQWKMQQFAADNINLMCEVALKMFREDSLDRYIVPKTLPPDHRDRYRQALNLLKADGSRFRVSLDTDSTIALNEEYNKEATKELVNALTTALEKTAQTAATNPALAIPELHALKYLVQAYRGGKVFQSELTQAIDQVIQGAQNAEPPFDASLAEANAKAEMDKQRLQIEWFKAQVDAFVKKQELAVRQNAEQFDQYFDIQTLQMKGQETGANLQIAEATLQEKWATEERLQREELRDEKALEMEAVERIRQNPAQPAAPVTIINAPQAPEPNTVIQPIAPVPIL